jgi:peptide/nickel transport system ATP-binding protein
VYFQGKELMGIKEREMRSIRGKEISLVFQSPLSALNPALRIGTQLREAWRVHSSRDSGEGTDNIVRAMESVSLPGDREFLSRYPSQLSVGQAQRVLIAMAVIHDPALLIADEPTSALDIVTQSEILGLFTRLNRQRRMAILYISHDLVSVASICSRIAILYNGEIVETGTTAQIFGRPVHPYTQQLIKAIPQKPAMSPPTLVPHEKLSHRSAVSPHAQHTSTEGL